MAELSCWDCVHSDVCCGIGSVSYHCTDVTKCKHFKNKADVEDVVRCEKCRYADDVDGVLYCIHWNKNTEADGYCYVGY